MSDGGGGGGGGGAIINDSDEGGGSVACRPCCGDNPRVVTHDKSAMTVSISLSLS